MRRNSADLAEFTTKISELKNKIGDLETEVKALRRERASLTQVTDLEREIETLRLEKDRLIEDNARKIRDTEHKVGLLQKKQEQDGAHQKRQIEVARQEAVLEVREKNLDHATSEFDKRMEYREQQFAQHQAQWEKHLADFRDMFGDAMKRLPNIDVALTGAIGRPPAADDDEPTPRRTSRTRKDAGD